MRVLMADEVTAALSLWELIDAIEQSFREHASGVLPGPERLDSYLEDGEFHVKAGHSSGFFAVKANSAFFGNPPQRPAIQGVLLLFDSSTGEPIAALHSGTVTALRTAAASAVAAKLLAPQDSDTLGVLGAGEQAWQHARALTAVRPVQLVRVWARRPDAGQALAARIRDELGMACETVDSAQAAARSSMVATCTPSSSPLLQAGDLLAGSFVAAVGADSAYKQELSGELTASCAVVPDLLEQALAVGELHHAVGRGVMASADVLGELGELLTASDPSALAAKARGRSILFDSTGTGFEDAAAAAMAVRVAAS
ncbi:ornithine cyclodeaminase family protein [Nonomuraea zeae]|uniref:Ornithine cyclodeaminase family protein n=1 Tax=Nonomuraea zeae TaxID=1642303 RepID=A0A5S4G456_9ACTN|nr:ornithine cyclodeaminase family protein [Nonomuraea zeae]TMR27768.1 ornithine cyclodeaminase family protein [Nonomuraea zeae]